MAMGVTYGAVLVWILEMPCPNKRRGVSAEREGDIANPSAPQTSRQGSQAAGKTESVPLHFTPLETGRDSSQTTRERDVIAAQAACTLEPPLVETMTRGLRSVLPS